MFLYNCGAAHFAPPGPLSSFIGGPIMRVGYGGYVVLSFYKRRFHDNIILKERILKSLYFSPRACGPRIAAACLIWEE